MQRILIDALVCSKAEFVFIDSKQVKDGDHCSNIQHQVLVCCLNQQLYGDNSTKG